MKNDFLHLKEEEMICFLENRIDSEEDWKKRYINLHIARCRTCREKLNKFKKLLKASE